MSGLSMQKGGGGKYLSTFKGNFVMKCDKNTPGAISRINKENNEVTELHFNTFVGFCTSITKKEGNYGLQWEVGLVAGGKKYILNLPYGGSMVISFFSRLVNVDFTKEILIGILEAEGTDKKLRTFFYIYQNPVQGSDGRWTGDKALPFWSRKEPNGLPPLDKIKRKGKEEFDDTKQMEYVEQFLTENVIPNLPVVETSGESAQDGPTDDPDEPQEEKKPEPKKAELPKWLQGKGKEEAKTATKPAPSKRGEKTPFKSPTNQDKAPDEQNDLDSLPF